MSQATGNREGAHEALRPEDSQVAGKELWTRPRLYPLDAAATEGVNLTGADVFGSTTS